MLLHTNESEISMTTKSKQTNFSKDDTKPTEQNNIPKNVTKKPGVRDIDAHYDIDGVSLSEDEVVVSGDNQTTQGAPLPQNLVSKHRIKNADVKSPGQT